MVIRGFPFVSGLLHRARAGGRFPPAPFSLGRPLGRPAGAPGLGGSDRSGGHVLGSRRAGRLRRAALIRAVSLVRRLLVAGLVGPLVLVLGVGVLRLLVLVLVVGAVALGLVLVLRVVTLGLVLVLGALGRVGLVPGLGVVRV